MKFFKKNELIALGIVIVGLLFISIPNFSVAWQRSRDVTRKDDLGFMVKALDSYKNGASIFPLSTEDGKIIACFRDNEEPKFDDKNNIINFVPCLWGEGSYLGELPNDPQEDKGASYFYISNGKRYQIFASLERTDQDEYDSDILSRNIKCGIKICNFGRSYSNTPLDISIEEYENEMEKAK